MSSYIKFNTFCFIPFYNKVLVIKSYKILLKDIEKAL